MPYSLDHPERLDDHPLLSKAASLRLSPLLKGLTPLPIMTSSLHDQLIGSYEAKNRLPDLLRQVDAGSSFTIKVQERPVARLIPIDATSSAEEAVAAMQTFMQKRITSPLNGDTFDELRRADQR